MNWLTCTLIGFVSQATELKCGGLVLGCTFDHRIADAYSANLFLTAWAATARRVPLPLAPSFRRSLLSPRRSGSCPTPEFDRLYTPLSAPPSPPSHPVTSRLYFISSADINSLQAAAGPKKTKIEAFTAYLWLALAKASSPDEKFCHMGAVVDGRPRFGPDMDGYFGNVLSLPFGTLEAEELSRMQLPDVAQEVHVWLRAAATAQHFRGLVDWVEGRRPAPLAARIYLGGEKGEKSGIGCLVSSGRRFPVEEVEFGWGRPAIGSYHFPWGGESGYVMPMPSPRGGGDWVVYVHLRRDLVEALEEEEPPLLVPLTAEHFLGPASAAAANGDAHPLPAAAGNGDAYLRA